MLYFVEGELKERSIMKPCQPEQWASLGDNYIDTFYAYGINNMYCPFTNTSLILQGTSRTKNSNNITIVLYLCNQ